MLQFLFLLGPRQRHWPLRTVAFFANKTFPEAFGSQNEVTRFLQLHNINSGLGMQSQSI